MPPLRASLLLAGLTTAACAAPLPAPAPAVPYAEAEPAPLEVPVLLPRPSLPHAERAAMEAPEPPEPGPELPADAYLAPGAGARFRGRALLAKNGPVRLTLDGDPSRHGSARPLGEPLEGIVVEEHPRSLRMVLADEHVRIAIYVRRDALHAVSVRPIWLSPVPGRAPDPTAGVHLAPGTVLAEKDRQGPLRKVSGEVENVRFEGWLPGEAVGAVFVAERFPTPYQNGLLAEGTAITAPGGEVLARLHDRPDRTSPPGFFYDAALLPGAPPGFQAVHLRRTGIEVRGLVPAAAAQKKTPGGGLGLSGIGEGGGGGAITDTEEALLPAGAGLFTPEGARVGVAVRPTQLWVSFGARRSKDRLVWATFHFSPLGFLQAHVRPGDLRPWP